MITNEDRHCSIVAHEASRDFVEIDRISRKSGEEKSHHTLHSQSN